MLSISSYPEQWCEGASFSPFAHSPVCLKQFCHMKAKSWTWLSDAIFCTHLVAYFVGIRCSISSTIPPMNIIIITIMIIIITISVIIIISILLLLQIYK